jgi:hypothetical protein
VAPATNSRKTYMSVGRAANDFAEVLGAQRVLFDFTGYLCLG